MSMVQLVIVGFAGVGFIGLFVLVVRSQVTNDRAIRAILQMHKELIGQHSAVLEHLMIASDPDAWRVKQLDKHRKERDARREKQGPPAELPPKRGVD